MSIVRQLCEHGLAGRGGGRDAWDMVIDAGRNPSDEVSIYLTKGDAGTVYDMVADGEMPKICMLLASGITTCSHIEIDNQDGDRFVRAYFFVCEPISMGAACYGVSMMVGSDALSTIGW